jgi:PilZ domain
MIEKRKDKRIKEENRVIIEASPAGAPGRDVAINAFTRDISLSGARIWTDMLFPLNSRLDMTLYLSRSRQVVRIRGTVKWEKECVDGLYEIGVKFQSGIPDVLMALINHFYGKEEAIPTEVNRWKPARVEPT